MSEYYDLPHFDPNNLSDAKIKHYTVIIIKQDRRAPEQEYLHIGNINPSF